MITSATVAQIEADPSFDALAAEYVAEASIWGMPSPVAKFATYRHLEAAGMLHVIVARIGGELIGFITVLFAPLPHYAGSAVAVSESFFVAAARRASGAGIKLLRAAEAKAKELGSPGLLVSAPFNGRLFEVLPRAGYVETNRIFFRRLADG